MRDFAARLERLEQQDRARTGSTASVQMRTAFVAVLKAGSNGERLTLADLDAEERAAIAAVRALAAGGRHDDAKPMSDARFIAEMAREKFFADEKGNR